jgi:hypothetical protein
MPADAAGHGPPTRPPPGPALPATGGWGGQMLMPDPWTRSVIQFAIWRHEFVHRFGPAQLEGQLRRPQQPVPPAVLVHRQFGRAAR